MRRISVGTALLLSVFLAVRFHPAAVAHAQAQAASPALEVGRCVGQAGPEIPPSGGELYDFRQDSRFHDQMPGWKLIGYKTDERSGRLFRQSHVTKAFVTWMNEPEDFSRVSVDFVVWVTLLEQGLRLDEATCVMRDPSGRALTRLEYQAQREVVRLGLARNALEALKLRLKGLGTSARVPPHVLRAMSSLSQAGTKLPPDIQSLLSGGRVRVGELLLSVDAAYAESTRFFDGQRSLKELVISAFPAMGKAEKMPSYRESAERRLGKLLAADLEKRFSLTDSGRELLDHFRDKKGRVDFPHMLVLKAVQTPNDPNSPGAFYDPMTGAITINHWMAAQVLLRYLPPEERARRSKEFFDSRGLGRYLEMHPRERGEFMGTFDSLFYHELIHAWQDRRSRFDVEMLRGNVVDVNPLVHEYEAYREQCRYIFNKSLSSPMALHRSGYTDKCLGMLKDYDSFQDGIRQLYTKTYAGSMDLPDVVRCQKERKSMARRLMSSGPVVQTLKLLGMSHGDAALQEMQSDSAKREREFRQERLFKLRRQVVGNLPEHYMAMERPDLALQIIDNLPPGMQGVSHLRYKSLSQLQEILVRHPKKFTLQERTSLYALFSEQGLSAELHGAYCRDAVAQAAFFKEQAEISKDPAVRAQLLSYAEQWSKIPGDALAQAVALKKQAQTTKDPVLRAQRLKYARELLKSLRQIGVKEN